MEVTLLVAVIVLIVWSIGLTTYVIIKNRAIRYDFDSLFYVNEQFENLLIIMQIKQLIYDIPLLDDCKNILVEGEDYEEAAYIKELIEESAKTIEFAITELPEEDQEQFIEMYSQLKNIYKICLDQNQ